MVLTPKNDQLKSEIAFLTSSVICKSYLKIISVDSVNFNDSNDTCCVYGQRVIPGVGVLNNRWDLFLVVPDGGSTGNRLGFHIAQHRT